MSGYLRLVERQNISKERKDELVHWFFNYMSHLDFNTVSPLIARDMHEYLRKELNCNDLFEEEKKLDNQKILDMLPEFKEAIADYKQPLIAALKLAIAGNIIDLGTDHGMDHSQVISNAIAKELAADDSSLLISAIKDANNFLYLCDNAGEIVFDKLFLDTLVDQGVLDRSKVIIAVRGEPILNDATLQDAKLIGLTEDYTVISNGDCSPGTCLEYTSDEFNKVFNKADFILSKGQGNYESLCSNKEKQIFFMLIAKCSLVANQLSVNVGDMVCKIANPI